MDAAFMTQPTNETVTPADVAQPVPGAASAPSSAGVDGKPPGTDSAATDKPGEPPKPAKAKDHAAVAREHFRLRQERKELKTSTQKAIDDMKAQLDQVLAQRKADADEVTRLKAEREEFLKDPISFAEKNGRKPDDVVTGYVKKGTPEAAIEDTKRQVAEERAKREALEKAIADKDERDKKDREEQAAKQKEAALSAAVSGFAHAVTQQGKKYPYLNAMYEPDEIRAKAAEFQKMAIAEGKAYSFDEVATAFETMAHKAYERKEAKRLELLTPDEGEPATAAGVQAKPVPGNGRREGTSGPGTTRTTPRPPDTPKLSRRLTRAEQDAADLAALRAAAAKDRAANRSS